MTTAPPYATREIVQRTLDSASTAHDATLIDRAVASASRSVDQLCHVRGFWPETATRYFDWPDETQRRKSWRIWLDSDILISVTSVTNGDGTTVTNYLLEPVNAGPPYRAIEIDLSSSDVFSSGDTHQQAVTIVGLWGHSNTTTSAGALAEALDDSETAVDVTDGTIGVGHLLTVDSERMLVTERTWLDSGQNTGGALTAAVNDQTVAVSDGTAFMAYETILVDSETMWVTAITGNNLTVERAYDGSTLATHSSSADVYVSRTLTVERGAAGTTAASHLTATAITRWVPPSLVEELTIAEAITQVEQGRSAYARTVGSGDNQREARGAGLQDLRDRCYGAHGRKNRHRAV